ncbi:hypothetical protein [Haliovirga abyssi]|uniref:Uncharacterized protein n=1 Tax=Haliovirga abyssi TaxID=2996794 RepID=A0AAU9D857_9FUSO|nr:hypothetical protein [Haliovirga abyssi]BDU49761.1 hypothetical protein HLVA_03300 [Haliovirga abyssi]
MEKKLIYLFFIMLFSTTIYASREQTKKINFSVLSVGDFNGEYKKIPKIFNIVKQTERLRDNLVKIDIGNNFSKIDNYNDIIMRFLKKSKFDFNFLGIDEFKSKVYIKENKFFSSLNLIENSVIPYKLIKKDNYILAIVGISNLYGKTDNLVDYKKELEKLIYKLDSKSDFVFIVSDLTRAENLNILAQFKDISILFESNSFSYNPIEKIGEQYIIANKNPILLDFVYNPNVAKQINKHNKNFSLKNLFIEDYKIIDDYSYYEEDNKLKDYINWKEEVEKKKNSEFKIFNNKTFYKENVLLGERIPFLDSIGEYLSYYYDSDTVAFVSSDIKRGLKKGIVTVKELKELLKNDNIEIYNISDLELQKLIKANKFFKGTDKYIYFINEYKNLGKKESYKIISTEEFENRFGYKGKVLNYTISDFLLQRR